MEDNTPSTTTTRSNTSIIYPPLPHPNNYLHHPQQPDTSPGSDHRRSIKSQIATHPLYPNLLSAFLDCKKVGAPPELASLLEEIDRQTQTNLPTDALLPHNDPDLDHFMESYCRILHRYKDELSKPFNEATSFFCNIQSQFTHLCKGSGSGTLTFSSSDNNNINNRSGEDEAAGTSEDELSCEKVETGEGTEYSGMRPGDQELKEMLLRKYGGYISSLRKEFLKKRKKGKLPKDARMVLMNWWNTHYRWPYPTEEEKLQLSEITGLDQKQINNWFINQRKRHWKPSQDLQFSIVEGVSGGSIGGGGPM